MVVTKPNVYVSEFFSIIYVMASNNGHFGGSDTRYYGPWDPNSMSGKMLTFLSSHNVTLPSTKVNIGELRSFNLARRARSIAT